MCQALVERQPSADREEQHGDDERPEVDFLAVAELMEIIRWAAGTTDADDQHDLVGGVDQRVDAFGEHRRLPVRKAAMNLAAAMPMLARSAPMTATGELPAWAACRLGCRHA